MILPSPRRRLWFRVSLAAFLGLVAGYTYYSTVLSRPHGGSVFGLALGILATLLILLLTAFGARKRAYRSTLGTLDGWLQAHVYLGLLTVPVVLFHAGFRFHDRVATVCFVIMVTVVLSGLAGAALYTAVPRRLTAVAGTQGAAELAEAVRRLGASMAQLAAGQSAAFQSLYRKLEGEARPAPLAPWRLVFLGSGAVSGGGGGDLGALLGLVESHEREDLERMLRLARQRRELHRRLRFQQRYRNMLQVWLYLHVPLTALLLGFVLVHVVLALYFRGI